MRRHIEAAVLMVVVCSAGFAQAPSSKPSFDVASIRPGSMRPVTLPSGVSVIGASQGGPGTSDPERYTGNSVTLRSILQIAYGVQAYQISGPGWIETARYDISAKVPVGATREQFKQMFQSLLEERFDLKLHRDTKEFPAYNLVPAKNGIKLRDAVSTDACSSGARPASGAPCPQEGMPQSGISRSTGSQGLFMVAPQGPAGRIATGRGVPISALANMLQGQLAGRVVIDKTGLTETYDFRLEFASAAASLQEDTPFPSLVTALETELGLKLEPTKTSVDILVIDHLDREPTEN